MSDQPYSPAQVRARDALKALAEPSADPAFRARVREEFVRARPEIRTGPRPSPRRTFARLATGLVAAAAVLAIALGIANQGPSWQVVVSRGLDHVMVDGARVPVGPDLAGHLRPGRELALPPGGVLEILSPGHLLLQLDGELTLTIPRSPGRWFDRRVASRLAGDGVLRVVTGPSFPGSELVMETDAAEVLVTGTTFTVMHHQGTACVCVLEGEVQACAPDDTRMTGIPSGQRMTFTEFGHAVAQGEILPGERVALSGLKARAPEFFAP